MAICAPSPNGCASRIELCNCGSAKDSGIWLPPTWRIRRTLGLPYWTVARTVALHFIARHFVEFPRKSAAAKQAHRLLKGIPASALSLARKGSTVLSSTQTSERNQLVENHLRNVQAAARRMKVYGALRDELVSAGYEALVRAGDRFDPTRNVTFTTFAFHPVLGSMYDHLRTHATWAANHVDIDSEKVEVSAPASAERQMLTAQVLAT